jgi:hypothetical protein
MGGFDPSAQTGIPSLADSEVAHTISRSIQPLRPGLRDAQMILTNTQA